MRGKKAKALRKATVMLIQKQTTVPTNFSFKNFVRQIKRNFNRGT